MREGYAVPRAPMRGAAEDAGRAAAATPRLRAEGAPGMRLALALLLAAALALACAWSAACVADAWAAESFAGVRLTAGPAQNEYDTPAGGEGAIPGASHVGIRLTGTPSQNEYDTPVGGAAGPGATHVGIRLTEAPAQNEYDTQVGDVAPGASHVGIRLTGTPSQNEYETPVGGEGALPGTSHVGIRLTKEPQQNEYETPVGGEVGPGATHVGIRLTATPAQNEYDTPVEGSEDVGPGASSVGIRLTGVQTFNVYFATGEGATAVAPQRVHAGDHAAPPAEVPSKPGFGFTGWYADAEAEVPYDFAGTPVRGTTTIYAGWIDAPVRVTFDAGGGTFDGDGAGVLHEDGTWSPQVEFDGKMVEGAYPGEGIADIDPPMPTHGSNVFAGWWTDDGLDEEGLPDGKWGERADDAWRVPREGAMLCARWITQSVTLRFVDPMDGSAAPDGGTYGPAEDWDAMAPVTGEDGIPAATLTPGAALPAGEAVSLGGAVPKRPGYRLAGLWCGSGEDAVMYYGTRSGSGSDADADGEGEGGSGSDADGGLRWAPADVGEGGWAWLWHAADEDGDRVGDTVELRARWDLVVRATLPAAVPFVLASQGDAAPEALAPDGFAIRSYTVTPLEVTRVDALGAGGEGGIPAVLYTSGEGASRTLDYAAMDGEIALTLEPGADAGSAPGADAPGADAATPMRLVLAGAAGPARDSTGAGGEEWTVAASHPTDASAQRRLPVAFGLELPSDVRAYESGAKGEIAKVTFTISARQAVSW